MIRNAGIHRTGVRSSLSGGRSRLEPARGVGRALAAALALIAARPLPPPAAAELAGPLVAMEQTDGGPAALATPVALADSTAGPPADTVIVVPPQSLDGLPIGVIEIEPHTIYDPVPAGRLRAFYRVANRLHVRTRRSTVRSQLLFRPGDPWSEARARELARNLRSLSFLLPTRIEPQRTGDSVTVRVATRDLWTTSPEFNFESSGGHRYGAIAFTDRNVLGLGKLLSFAWRHDPVGISQDLSYIDPDVYGSHAQLELTAGNGSGGATKRVGLGVPFWALETRHSYDGSWSRSTSDAVLYDRASEVARIQQKLDETELWWGHGGWTDSTIRRFTYALLVRDKRLGPTVQTGAVPAPPEFGGGASPPQRLRRLDVEMRLWRPSYIERTDVELMGTTEDFDVGSSLRLKVGYAPGWFGGEEEGYTRVHMDRGVSTRFGFGLAQGSIESRLRRSPHDLLGRVDARWIQQSTDRGTLVASAQGVAGLHTERDFQLILGGLNGLRAYPVQAIAGRRLWRLNAEQRWKVADVLGELLSVGAVAFADGARGWGPGAAGSGWFVDSGIGLRFTVPQWTFGRVLRLDLAWPVTPTRDGRRQPVVSFGSSQAF